MKKQLLFILPFALFCLNANAQTIIGVDVAHFDSDPPNGPENWAKVKAAGYTFAWSKSTQGVTFTDSSFVRNMKDGVAAGMVMGAYHFADPESNTAVNEANFFVSVAGPYIKACELPPVLDLEDPPTGPALSSAFTSAQLTAWVQSWMSTVQTATGIAPILYTNGNYATYLNASLNTYGLWVADPDGSQTNPPANIGSWTTWDFKQFSWTTAVSGIGATQVDIDVFNGTTTAFNSLIGCPTSAANFTSDVTKGCPGMSVNFTDKSTSTGSLTGWSWTFTGATPSSSKVQNPTGIVYNTSGTYPVKEVVTSTTGKDSITKIGYITIAASGTLPLVETFQSATFPPAGWVLNLPNPNDSVWHLCTFTGSASTQCMYFPANCGNVSDITGERQQLYTPSYNFGSAVNPKMWFDVAYEPSKVPTYSDTLDIYYSLDCGATWTMVYSKGGATLCTTGGSTSAGTDTVGGHGCFLPPNSKAWRTDSVNISTVAGKPSVMFSIESRSGWGNIIYVDNINVTASPTSVQNLSENIGIKVYPNPNNGNFNIEITNYESGMKGTVEIYDMLGQQVYNASVCGGITQVNLNAKTGMYFYRVMNEAGDKLISEGKLIIQ